MAQVWFVDGVSAQQLQGLHVGIPLIPPMDRTGEDRMTEDARSLFHGHFAGSSFFGG